MSEMSFEQMLEESFKTIRNGEVVEGTVIDVKPDEIILNIGYKSDGIITRNEYTNEPNVDLTTVISVGDTMEAKVLKVNDGEGQVMLTYKRLAAEKGSKRLEEAFNTQEVLTAKVRAMLRRSYDFGGQTGILEHNGVILNLSEAVLVYNNYKIELAKNEYKILQILMENNGKVVSRDDLMAKLWESDSYVDENTLSVNISRLRKTLESIGLSGFIMTKKGIGYKVA